MSLFAMINTVSPSAIIRRAEFDEAPHLAAAKGLKWIPDNPPAYDPAKQTRAEVSPVPVDAEEVPYTVAAIPLATLKARKKAALREAFDRRGNALVSGYADRERETWPEQVRAAQAYEADPTGDHSYLQALAKEGEALSAVVENILTKHTAFLNASAPLIRTRREIEAAIDAATTADDVLAVDVESGWPF